MGVLSVRAAYGADPQNAGESQCLMMPLYAGSTVDGTLPAVYHCHGAGSDAHAATACPADWAAAQQGYPVIGRSWILPDAWGNDAALARLDQAIAWSSATLGAKAPAKVGIIGSSMGSLMAMRYARANPSSIAFLILITPLVNMDDFVGNNRGGYQSSVYSAYGGSTAYNAAAATIDPSQYPTALTGIPIRLYYSEDDTLALPTLIDPFISAVGGSAIDKVSLGSVGHAGASAFVDYADSLSFIRAHRP